MLWNSIYEFFVTKIFGGIYNGFSYSAIFYYSTTSYATPIRTANATINLFGHDLAVGNYLSFVATLITIIIILVLCCLFIKKIISLMGKLFSGGTL